MSLEKCVFLSACFEKCHSHMFKSSDSALDCRDPHSSSSPTLSNLFFLPLNSLIYKLEIRALIEWFEWLNEIIYVHLIP